MSNQMRTARKKNIFIIMLEIQQKNKTPNPPRLSSAWGGHIAAVLSFKEETSP